MFTRSRAVDTLVGLIKDCADAKAAAAKAEAAAQRNSGGGGGGDGLGGGLGGLGGLGGDDDYDEEDANNEDLLLALGVLHRIAVALPAAAPKAIAEHRDALPFLTAVLEGKHRKQHLLQQEQ